MIEIVLKSFNFQLDNLAQHLQRNYHEVSPESGFTQYVFHQARNKLPFDTADGSSFVSKIEPSRLNQAPILATVGYCLTCDKKFDKKFLETWENGLARLSGRETFPRDRTSFFYRPTELLGIALGISCYYQKQSKYSKWLEDILIQGEKRLIHSDLWTFLLSAHAAKLISVDWKPRGLLSVNEMTIDELSLVKWLCSVDPNFASKFGLIQLETLANRALLEKGIEFSEIFQDMPRAALLYFSLKKTINQILWSSCNNREAIYCNTQKTIEWLRLTFDNIHPVVEHLRSKSASLLNLGSSNVYDLQALLRILPQLRSDAEAIETEISNQIKMSSSLPVFNNSNIFLPGAIKHMTQNNSTSNQTTVNAPNSSIGFVQSGSGTISGFSQNIGQNTDEIFGLIDALREKLKEFPETQREEATVHLDDLQEDITVTDKRTPQRIKARLVALLAVVSTIAGVVAGANDFSNNVLELAEKLGVPIELIQSQTNQKLSPTESNQPSNKLIP